jgi:hypothetical protein
MTAVFFSIGKWSGCLGLRRDQFANYIARLCLLLVANLSFWCRVHAGVCQRIWITDQNQTNTLCRSSAKRLKKRQGALIRDWQLRRRNLSRLSFAIRRAIPDLPQPEYILGNRNGYAMRLFLYDAKQRNYFDAQQLDRNAQRRPGGV